MYAPLIAMAGVSVLIAGVVAWAVARRYGRRPALGVPVLAVAASIVSAVRVGGLEDGNAVARVAIAMAFAGPAVVGSLVGLALARSGRP
jgi:hypothetical protein